MKYTINQLHDILYKKVLGVYDVFKDFFGEQYVDLQIISADQIKEIITNRLTLYKITGSEEGYEMPEDEVSKLCDVLKDMKSIIYVWFPRVTVTNENNKSIEIQDLYAKVVVQLEGKIPMENYGFELNRATYPMDQFESDYMHSHIKCIPKRDFTIFMPPCLGSGPIKDTILTLKNDCDVAMWMLFCEELSMYVTVESLHGGPWKRMETVGATQKLATYTGYSPEIANKQEFVSIFNNGREALKEFMKYYLKNGHLQLSFINNKFTCGMPYHEYIIDVSNAFIDYFNNCLKVTREVLDSCYRNHFLESALFDNGSFYKKEDLVSLQSLEAYQHKFVLRFKGKDIYTKIMTTHKSNSSVVTIVSHGFAMSVLNSILRTINYRYRNENNERRKQVHSATGQRVIYL